MKQYSIPENVAVSDSGFLFLPSTGETFTMNEIGKEIFKQLQQKIPLDNIISNLLNEYDIDKSSLEKDINDFLLQLKNYNVVKEI